MSYPKNITYYKLSMVGDPQEKVYIGETSCGLRKQILSISRAYRSETNLKKYDILFEYLRCVLHLEFENIRAWDRVVRCEVLEDYTAQDYEERKRRLLIHIGAVDGRHLLRRAPYDHSDYRARWYAEHKDEISRRNGIKYAANREVMKARTIAQYTRNKAILVECACGSRTTIRGRPLNKTNILKHMIDTCGVIPNDPNAPLYTIIEDDPAPPEGGAY